MKIIRRLKNKYTQKKVIKESEHSIDCITVYNSKDRLTILISFDLVYSSDIIEFLTYTSGIIGLTVTYHNSWHEEKILPDSFSKSYILRHNNYYLLISGNDKAYDTLYYCSSNIANAILNRIAIEILNNRTYNAYPTFMDVYGYTKNRFIKKPEYDKNIIVDGRYEYTDIKLLLSRLPKIFTSVDLLKLVDCYYYNDLTTKRITLYEFIVTIYKTNNLYFKTMKEMYFKDLFNCIYKDATDLMLKNLVGPKYLIQDNDLIPGDLDNESLDDIFKQKYEKFYGVKSNDIEYQDIDEVISVLKNEEGEDEDE